MPILTIFTPTYNRAHTLVRTYESLKRQSCKDFEWLIVDDGSTDNTEAVVAEWKKADNNFAIRYVKQPNGGKYMAHNAAIRLAEGDFFFTVDSDDWLPDDSVATIVAAIPQMADDKCCGMIALKSYGNGGVIGKMLPSDIHYSSAFDLQCQGYGGERSLVFKTEIIRRYPFPEILNEKFATECIVYDRIDITYQYYVLNYSLTICEYQTDGLSANPFRVMINNPTGYKIYYSNRIDMARKEKERFGYIIRYLVFKSLSKNPNFNYSGPHGLCVNLCYPFGILAKYYYLFKVKL